MAVDARATALVALASIPANPANLLLYAVDLSEAAVADQSKKMALTLLDSRFATAAQGIKADGALQPANVGSAAYAAIADFATAAQGALAATALQNAALFATSAQGAKADTALQNAAAFATAAQGAKADTALQNAAAFATAAQGTKADSALQAAAIGVSVQAYNAGLSAITAFGYSLIDDANAAAGLATLTAAGTGVANTFTAAQIVDVATDIIPLTLEKSASQTANIFQIRQAAAANLLTHIKNNGQMEVIFDANIAPSFQVSRLAGTIYLRIGGNNVGSYVNGENVNTSGGAIWTVQGTAARNGSAGSNVSALLVNATINPTSGASEHYGFRLAPTINQTVATGDVTIFSVAPTLTAVVGTLRYFEFFDGANRVFEIGRYGHTKVNQVSTTAAVPSLWLNQADLSEEFIRFQSTVGAGNPINTTALGSYYGRVRVYVEGVGAKWLALYD